ncbi:MAG: hypothetical protein KBT47_09760 [Armatimonadetes bacterium]|nr:hypothetical protein [Candidatus Hippobium faecium]
MDKIHVISHTHWDREWSRTFQQFRIKLVDLIDNLLDTLDNDPEFKIFNMDGQTIVLEDYLAIKPYNEEKIRKYVKEGRITVGPWYQLNDENLVSGESTVRSLLIGHQIAKDFGHISKVGYLPDQFGNISQMPQIFKGFGIDYSVFGRGYIIDETKDKTEFMWVGSDKSEVVSTLMARWYNNAQCFPNDKEECPEYIKERYDVHKSLTDTSHLLFMNGVDHLEPQYEVGQIINKMNPGLKDCVLVHDSLENYCNEIKAEIEEKNIPLKRREGELRDDMLLAGTLSSRPFIKQKNNACEQLLEKYAEPLNTFSLICNEKYYYDFIKYAWKYLMQNHPHDSICGCSVDAVHAQMNTRFEEVKQIGESLRDRALKNITRHIKTEDNSLVVFNTLNHDRTEVVRAEINIELAKPERVQQGNIDKSKDFINFTMKDCLDNPVDFKILHTDIRNLPVYDPHELPLTGVYRHFDVEFLAEEVPAFGYKTFSIEKALYSEKYENSLTKGYADREINNGIVSVQVVDNNNVMITNIEKDVCVYNANIIEDIADIGDEYRYKSPETDRIILNNNSLTEVSVIDNSPISATLCCKYDLKLPECFDYENNRRSERLVNCPVTVEYTIEKDRDVVKIKTTFENNAKDHKVRALFPTETDTDFAYAEMPFDVVKRDLQIPDSWQESSRVQPLKTWFALEDDEKSVGVLSKGLQEYEILPDASNTMALTLFRSINKISNEGDAGNMIYTPEAWYLGTHVFEYALYLSDDRFTADTESENDIVNKAHDFNAPMIAVQSDKTEKGKTQETATMEPINNFLAVSDERIVFSALKRAEDGSGIILRLYNPYFEDINDVKIRFFDAKEAFVTNLNEETVSALDMEEATVSVDVGAKKIITLKFVL